MIKVKIVAIAKDEGAYFPEWVHHHFFVGVSAIDVYINRTTDNSADVLKKIGQSYPNVELKSADWIDFCVPAVKSAMQYITYAKAFAEEKERGEFTHLLFIDIDEFWIAKNFDKKLPDFISEVGVDNPIAFEWLNECPSSIPFSNISNEIVGTGSNLVKTLVPLSANIQDIDIHLPKFTNDTKEILLSDGSACRRLPDMKQAVHTDLVNIKDYFILHRASRSHYEYVSLLLKGNPEDDYPFKQNRKGVRTFGDEVIQTIHIKESQFSEYKKSYENFYNSCGFSNEIKKAKQFVDERYSNSILALKKTIDSNYHVLRILFMGVDILEVRDVFKNYRTSIINSGEYTLRDLQFFYNETIIHCEEEAFTYISLAKNINPDGPWINEQYNILSAKLGRN